MIPVIFQDATIRACYKEYLAQHPQFRAYVRFKIVPFTHYSVYQEWKPLSIKTLFIAESPPWGDLRHYFYDPEVNNRLSLTLFRLLGIEGQTKREQLVRFKERRFFLIDTIQAIYLKKDHAIPRHLIHWSASHLLKDQIEILHPQEIITLGTTAFLGVKHLYELGGNSLKESTLSKNLGTAIPWKNKTIHFSVYPNDRNRRFFPLIENLFSPKHS